MQAINPPVRPATRGPRWSPGLPLNPGTGRKIRWCSKRVKTHARTDPDFLRTCFTRFEKGAERTSAPDRIAEEGQRSRQPCGGRHGLTSGLFSTIMVPCSMRRELLALPGQTASQARVEKTLGGFVDRPTGTPWTPQRWIKVGAVEVGVALRRGERATSDSFMQPSKRTLPRQKSVGRYPAVSTLVKG
jgi:hypothetical protein